MSTKKNRSITNLFAFMLAATLIVAGCGGGGGGGEDPPMMPDPPPPPPTSSVTIPDGMYLDEDNAPAPGHHDIAAGESATNNGVVFSCPAGGDDCEVDVMADGSVTSTGGEATAALSADAMTQVAQAKQAAREEAARAALENRDRIIGKDRAIEAAANIGGTTGPEEAAIIITRASSAPAATVRSTGYSASEEPILPNPGWSASRLMQTAGGNTNHLFVYTDIEAPTRIQFYDFDRDASTPARYVDPNTAAPAVGTPYGPGDTIVGLELGTEAAPATAATLDLTRFPAPGPVEDGNIVQNYAANADLTDDGTPNAVDVSIPGNYNGAGGRYECVSTTSGCSVTVTPGGAYNLGGGTWRFVPELNATAWLQDGETAQFGTIARRVGDFMSFGWWLQEPTAQTGVYTFRYYANGSDPFVTPAGAVLATGSAVYNGQAAGKYVVQEIEDNGVVDGEAGMFTAAASLTASFTGGDSGSAGSISGTISGFQTDNADVDVSGWTVTLNSQTFLNANGVSGTTVRDPTVNGFDGATATMGGQTAHGTWTSQFFGNQVPSANTANDNDYPLGVGGTFQADNDEVSIGGAFGARR